MIIYPVMTNRDDFRLLLDTNYECPREDAVDMMPVSIASDRYPARAVIVTPRVPQN